jgi:hypothetical protein
MYALKLLAKLTLFIFVTTIIAHPVCSTFLPTWAFSNYHDLQVAHPAHIALESVSE